MGSADEAVVLAFNAAINRGDLPGLGRLMADDHRFIDTAGNTRRLAQLLGHPGADPLIAAAAQGGGRAAVVGDAPVAAAEDQDLDELVEDDPVGNAQAVAAERMVNPMGGE